jgi:pyruvate dehydrogenase E1 component beta subunit
VHTAGLKVVCPSNPHDAKGLLASAIKDEDPVLFFEPKRVYRAVKMEVPDERYETPLSVGKVVREGDHVTIVAWGAMLYEALTAAEQAAEQGIQCEVIDPRTLWPMDFELIARSVEKTGRIVVVHEAPKACGLGAEILQTVCEKSFVHLMAPPTRVTGFDTPFPYTLENEYLPLAHRILPKLVEVARY